MAFKSTFDHIRETPEEEKVRLAAAPRGSTNHGLSLLPVNIDKGLEGVIVKLPKLPLVDGTLSGHTMIVSPVKRSAESGSVRDARVERGEKPYLRNEGYWECIVVASDHPSYPVGGHRLSISEAELVRGTSMESVFEQELTGQKALRPEAEAQTQVAETGSLGAAWVSIANLVSARDGQAARAIADGAMVQMTSDEGSFYKLPLRELVHELFQDAARLEAEKVSRLTGFEAKSARLDALKIEQGGAFEGFEAHAENPRVAELQQPHSQAAAVWKKFPELNPANQPQDSSADGTDLDVQR